MSATKPTHLVICHPDRHGYAVIIPADWERVVRDDEQELVDVELDPWEEAHAHGAALGTVVVEWEEDETFVPFADAVIGAGFQAPTATRSDGIYTTTTIGTGEHR